MFETLWFLIKPHYAIIFDISEETSIRRVSKRDEPIRYTKEVLSFERKMYLAIAKKYKYPIVPTEYPREITDHMCKEIAEKIIKTIMGG